MERDKIVWTRGTRSNGSGGNNCVEVAKLDGGYALRNSRHPEQVLPVFTEAEWIAFLDSAQAGEFRNL